MTLKILLYLAALVCFVVVVALDITDSEFLMTWVGWAGAGLAFFTLPNLVKDRTL